MTTKTPATTADALRLTLHIRGVCYLARPIGSETTEVRRAWRLKKLDGTIYDVADTRYGPTCDCPDQVFRHEGLDDVGCKHIRALRKFGLIDGETRAEPKGNRARVGR